MENPNLKSKVVNDDTEFYVTVALFRKPLTIKSLDGSTSVQLSEMECKALLKPPGTEGNCQCCAGDFPPPYPFIVEES